MARAPRLMCCFCKAKPVRKLSTTRAYARQWFCSVRCAADSGMIDVVHSVQLCEIGNHFFAGGEGDRCFEHKLLEDER